MRFPSLLLALLPALALPGADLVVIANPAAGIEKLTRDEVMNLFLGRARRLPSGVPAIPVDLRGDAAVRAAFYQALTGKDLAMINAYWARLLFSGQASPPRQAESEDEVLDLVRSNKGALGFVERKRVDRRVKVVLELNP